MKDIVQVNNMKAFVLARKQDGLVRNVKILAAVANPNGKILH